jgi:hypothetical protein
MPPVHSKGSDFITANFHGYKGYSLNCWKAWADQWPLGAWATWENNQERNQHGGQIGVATWYRDEGESAWWANRGIPPEVPGASSPFMYIAVPPAQLPVEVEPPPAKHVGAPAASSSSQLPESLSSLQLSESLTGLASRRRGTASGAREHQRRSVVLTPAPSIRAPGLRDSSRSSRSRSPSGLRAPPIRFLTNVRGRTVRR